MTATFNRALQFTLRWEGGYVNDPTDRGGETNFGISKRAYPNVDIAGLTIWDAAEIYERDYWAPIHGDEMGTATATALFDFAVNSGVPRASRALQRVIGARQDGEIGPKTLLAVGTRLQGPSGIVDQALAHDLIAERVDHLRDLSTAHEVIAQRVRLISGFVAAQPAQVRFLRGWMRRVLELTRFVENL